MRASRCSGVRSGSMRGRRRKVGAMSELRPDAQADGERRVGMVEPACDVEAQRPYRRFQAHADANAAMPVRFGAVEGAAAVGEQDRTRDVSGKRRSVRVDLGGPCTRKDTIQRKDPTKN